MAIYRHGDVVLKGVPKNSTGAPGNPLITETYKNEYVVAEGEATGHAHRLQAKTIKVRLFPGKTLVDLVEGGGLTHEEHGELTIKPGTYEVGQERELDYDAKEAYAVAD